MAKDLDRIHQDGRKLYDEGKHPMGSYRLGSLEDQALRRGWFERKREVEGR